MRTLKLVEVEGELGLIFSDQVLKRLNRSVGDVVYLTEISNGFVLSSDQAGVDTAGQNAIPDLK